MGAKSYGSRGMDDTAPPHPARAGVRGRTPGPRPRLLGSFPRGRARDRLEARAAAVDRGRDLVVAAERLGELRGLAVADAMGDLADREPARAEHLGGATHAHRGQ